MKCLILILSIFFSSSALCQDDFFFETANKLCDTLTHVKSVNDSISQADCNSVMSWSKGFNPDKWDSVYTYCRNEFDMSEYNFMLAYRHILLQECPTYQEIDDRIYHHSPNSIVYKKNYQIIMRFILMVENREVDTTYATNLFGVQHWDQIATDMAILDSIFGAIKRTTTINVYSGRLDKGTGVSVDLRNYKTRTNVLSVEFYFDPNKFTPTIKEYEIKDAEQIRKEREEKKKRINSDEVLPPRPSVIIKD